MVERVDIKYDGSVNDWIIQSGEKSLHMCVFILTIWVKI